MSKIVAIRAIDLFLALAIAGCSSGRNGYAVGGVEYRFCVPKSRDVGDTWWIPENAPNTPPGFSFTGCREGNISEADCEVPLELIGANVESLKSSSLEDWASMKKSAMFSLMSQDPSAGYQVDPKTGYVVLSANTFKQWFIFRKSQEGRAGANLEDGDLIVGYCSKAADIAGALTHGIRKDHACHRRARGPNYAISYFFVSSDPVPVEVEALDQRVFRAIESWRCK